MGSDGILLPVLDVPVEYDEVDGERFPYLSVPLTREEWYYASCKGNERQIDAALKNRTPRNMVAAYQKSSDAWGWQANGASGERVVAKWCGVRWDGAFGNLRAADVGPLLQVRTTWRHDFPLRIEATDDPGKLFTHVTGEGPVWRIHGFILARHAQEHADWFYEGPPPYYKKTGHGPAFWVPRKVLNTNFDLVRERYRAYIERLAAPSVTSPAGTRPELRIVPSSSA